MKAGVLKETWPGETRVAVVPGVVPALVKAGIEVAIESGAGDAAGFPDGQYAERGAAAVGRDQVLAEATLLLSVRSFSGGHDADATSRLGPRHVVIGFLDPLQRPEGARALAARGLTSFALESVPRISRAQSMDALSSTATMVGYKAVLLAANTLPRMMPMMMTAAGTVAPARVFVIGAGVAGLQAIATARRLGAVVEAYDVRPAVKDQIHSLGAGSPSCRSRRRRPRTRAATRRPRTRASTGGSGSCWRRSWRTATSSSAPPPSPARRRPSSSPTRCCAECGRGPSWWTSRPSRAATARRARPGRTWSGTGSWCWRR